MSIITLTDGTIFDLTENFPSVTAPVSVSCSGGIESTLLLYLLLQMYGAREVHVCTGVIPGRRSWESENAVRVAQLLGATNIHRIEDNFTVMSPEEQINLIANVRQNYSTGNHYIGEALTWYSANSTDAEREARSRVNRGIMIPFIRARLTKRHVIDLYVQLGIQHLLGETYSCTVKGDIHCGQCYCCHERVRGFNELGMVDTVPYERPWDTMVSRLNMPELIKKNW